MRLATWNLARRVPPPSPYGVALQRAIDATRADAFVLTETDVGYVPDGSADGEFSDTPDRPGRADERWVAIWTRLPIIERLETSDPARTVAVRLDAGPGEIVVYGTVLPWLSDRRKGRAVHGAAAFVAELESQASDWKTLLERFPEAALCVAGDFNQDLNDRHYYGSRIGRRALQATMAKLGLRCCTGGATDPVARDTDGRRGNIDHLLVNRILHDRWRAPSRAWATPHVNGRPATDHWGIAAEFDWSVSL